MDCGDARYRKPIPGGADIYSFTFGATRRCDIGMGVTGVGWAVGATGQTVSGCDPVGVVVG